MAPTSSLHDVTPDNIPSAVVVSVHEQLDFALLKQKELIRAEQSRRELVVE